MGARLVQHDTLGRYGIGGLQQPLRHFADAALGTLGATIGLSDFGLWLQCHRIERAVPAVHWVRPG